MPLRRIPAKFRNITAPGNRIRKNKIFIFRIFLAINKICRTITLLNIIGFFYLFLIIQGALMQPSEDKNLNRQQAESNGFPGPGKMILIVVMVLAFLLGLMLLTDPFATQKMRSILHIIHSAF